MSSDLVVQDQVYWDGKYLQSLAQQTTPVSVLLDYWHSGYNWNGSTENFNMNDPNTKALIWFLRISFALYAGYLAFKCNFVPTKDEPYRGLGMAIFYALIAALFGPLYLIYYLFVHCLGDKYLESIGLPTACPSKINKLVNELGQVTYPTNIEELEIAMK